MTRADRRGGWASVVLVLALPLLTLAALRHPPATADLPEVGGMRLGRGRITALATSPDGAQVAVGSGAGLWVLDAATFELLWHGPTPGPVTAAAFDPAGERVAAAAGEAAVVWEAHSGEPVFAVDDLTGVALDVALDERRVVIGAHGGSVLVFDLRSGVLRRQINTAGPVTALALAPDGRTLAVGLARDDDPFIRLINLRTGGRAGALRGHSGPVRALAFSPDGRVLASGSDDDTVALWDPATGSRLRDLHGHSSLVWDVAFSPGGERILSTSRDGTAVVWSVAGGGQLNRYSFHLGDVVGGRWLPDGRVVLASADNSVTVWRERNMLRVYTGQHDPWVESVAWGPDHIAAGLNNGTLIWYDGETGQLVHREAHAHQAGIEGVAFSREGHLASVSGLANGSDYALVIWRGMQRHLTLQGLYAAAWSPAGGQIAAGLGQQLVLYDAATGQPQHAYTAHADAIRDVTWQNGTLASAGQDATAVIWDEVGGHAMLHTLDARAQAATSASVADNGFLAVGHRGGVTIWRGQWPYTVRVGRDVWVTDVAYYGDLLAAATDDGRVLLVRGLTIHETLHGHAAGINALAWSPHGDRLASASADGTVILWEVTP